MSASEMPARPRLRVSAGGPTPALMTDAVARLARLGGRARRRRRPATRAGRSYTYRDVPAARRGRRRGSPRRRRRARRARRPAPRGVRRVLRHRHRRVARRRRRGAAQRQPAAARRRLAARQGGARATSWCLSAGVSPSAADGPARLVAHARRRGAGRAASRPSRRDDGRARTPVRARRRHGRRRPDAGRGPTSSR